MQPVQHSSLCSALSSWLRWNLTADDELSCTMNLVNSAYYESIQALINPFVRPFCGASSKQMQNESDQFC